MKLGVVQRARDPMSLAAYRDHVVRGLPEHGIECVPVPVGGPLTPGLDLLWDPGLGMRWVPTVMVRSRVPVVGTVHGLLGFVLPWRETARGLPALARLTLRALGVRIGWRALRRSIRRVIAVSPYGADEVREVLRVPIEVVTPILHGVDHETFRPDGPREDRSRPYLLVVAQYQPKKNVDRILEAYSGLADAGTRPDLLAVVPGYPAGRHAPDGATIERAARGPDELARLYRGALGLVAPSLHETFGMPIAEAMACGCPVVTSNVTACPQIAGDAAILVDPRSVDAIRTAMARVTSDEALRADLAARGVARASDLTWSASTAAHAKVFQEAVS